MCILLFTLQLEQAGCTQHTNIIIQKGATFTWNHHSFNYLNFMRVTQKFLQRTIASIEWCHCLFMTSYVCLSGAGTCVHCTVCLSWLRCCAWRFWGAWHCYPYAGNSLMTLGMYFHTSRKFDPGCQCEGAFNHTSFHRLDTKGSD